MTGKVIVITGANGGLGSTLSKRFADDGDRVVLLGRSLAKVSKVAEEIGERARAFECVVSSPESVRSAFDNIREAYDNIDVLINNAGVFKPTTVEHASEELVVDTISSNLTGAILCARAAIPLLKRGGHIINVSSESVVAELPHLVLYQAAKAGLERFSSSLNLELADAGVRVTVVRAGQMLSPGRMATDIDPAAQARLFEAALARGFNLAQRGTSDYRSTTHIFRMIIDSPADLTIDTVSFQGRLVSAEESS